MKRNHMKLVSTFLIFSLLIIIGGSNMVILASEDAQIPGISTQPGNVTANIDDVVILSVVAGITDGGTLSYQWFLNTTDSNTGGSPIVGANSPSLVPSTTHEGILFYYVVITNTNSSVTGNQTANITSNAARVTVSAAVEVNAQRPSITASPRGGSVVINEQFTLSVTAEVNDGGSLSYQWFSNTSNSNAGGTAIRGATARSYSPPTGQEGTVFYYVEVTNTNNNVNGETTASVTSSTANVTVNSPVNAQAPNIIRQPEGGILTLNDNITLTVSAEARDNGTLSYQWFSNDVNDNTGGILIRGATGPTFTPDTRVLGQTYYYVEVTNLNNTVTGERSVMTPSHAVLVNVSTTPGAPQYLSADTGADYVILTWSPPLDDGGSEIIGYQISDNVATLWEDVLWDSEHMISGLNSDTEYTFRLRALNVIGPGEEATISIVTAESGNIYVTGISLNELKINIPVGDSIALEATISPMDASDTSITWDSSDTEVAVVDRHGIVSALSEGVAIITVTTNDGLHTASCVITVVNAGSSIGNPVLWIVLAILVLSIAGAGFYVWKKKKDAGNNPVNKQGGTGPINRQGGTRPVNKQNGKPR